jgi:hypothetical protein
MSTTLTTPTATIWPPIPTPSAAVGSDPNAVKAKADAAAKEKQAAAEERAAAAEKAREALPVVLPTIVVRSGRQKVGFLVEFYVEGNLEWTVWRATEPTAADLLDLELAAKAGVAARGNCTIAVLATDVHALFAGTAPVVGKEAIVVDLPAAAVAGTETTYTGTYAGAAPAALDYEFDGSGWVPAEGATIEAE